MKKGILLIIIVINVFFLGGQENSNRDLQSQHSLLINSSLFFEERYGSKTNPTLISMSYNYGWQNKKKSYLHNNVSLGLGEIYFGSFKNDIRVVVDYSLTIRRGRHFILLGGGVVADPFLLHLNLGYKYYFHDNWLFRFVVMPSTYAVPDIMNSSNGVHKFTFVNFSLGYRFGSKVSQAIINTKNHFINRLEVQYYMNLLSFSTKKKIKPTSVLLINYSFYENRNNFLQFGFGIGDFGTGAFHFQINYLNIIKRHYFESNINLISVTLLNPNYEWKIDKYKLFQLQLGYRYQFYKEKFFAKVAYAPYIRTLDWKREGGLKHNIVFGVGYWFRK